MDINIAVCDDNAQMLQSIANKIRNANWRNNKVTINSFVSGKELLQSIKQGVKYNVIFMDIELDDNYLGTDTGIIIKMIDPSILIIYVSSYDSYFSEVAQAEPFAFLPKPLDENKLDGVIEKILYRLHYMHNSYMYTFKSNGMINHVNLNDVKYFESQHRVVIIYENNGTVFRFYSKLDDVEKEVNNISPYFVRVNKSFLVNINFIEEIHSNHIVVPDITINITEKYKRNFMAKLTKKFIQDFD